MSRLVHLNALQALDAALRLGTLRQAAAELGITPAAVGQRIRALETYVGAPLLDRGLAGVTATPAAEAIRHRLADGFASLRDAAGDLNLDRDGPVRLRGDADWLALWLAPRLPDLALRHPSLRLDILDSARDGAADLDVSFGPEDRGEMLWQEYLTPVATPETCARLIRTAATPILEGYPLLHLAGPYGPGVERGWPNWVAAFGQRATGAERGVRHRSVVEALASVDAHAGILLCPLSLASDRLAAGTLRQLPHFTGRLPARNAFRLRPSARARPRHNLALFLHWLRGQAQAFHAATG